MASTSKLSRETEKRHTIICLSARNQRSSDLLRKPKLHPLCHELTKLANIGKGHYSIDKHGMLTRRSRLGEASLQIVPTTLRPTLLYHARDRLLASHLGGRRMYDTMKRLYGWPHMANEVYIYVENCLDCRKCR